MARRFYRTIKQEMPSVADFVSDRERGAPMPRNPDKVRYWRGLSVFETLEQARERAIANPRQGEYVAELVIPDDGRITYERWGRHEGHHTLWGDARDLFAAVHAIYPVRPPPEG